MPPQSFDGRHQYLNNYFTDKTNGHANGGSKPVVIEENDDACYQEFHSSLATNINKVTSQDLKKEKGRRAHFSLGKGRGSIFLFFCQVFDSINIMLLMLPLKFKNIMKLEYGF